MNSNKICDDILDSWREEMHKPAPRDYNPGDHWRFAHIREAEAYANIVNSWGSSVGFLILRMPSFVRTDGVRRRYLDMCALWRRVTNSRLRSSGFSYGGLRAVEFIPLRNLVIGRTGDMVDVCFRVACNSREDALVILSHWVSILRLPVPEVVVHSSSVGDSRHLDGVEYGRGTSTDVWGFIHSLLTSNNAVSVDIAGQTIGGSEIAQSMFCRYVDNDFVWDPMFRYKYVIPFGRYDSKYKGAKRADRPTAAPVDDIEHLSWVVPRFEHIVEYSSPQTATAIRKLFKYADFADSGSYKSAIWAELLSEFGFDCKKDLGAIAKSVSELVARYNRRLLSSLCDSVCEAIGAVDTWTDSVTGRFDVETEYNELNSDLQKLRKSLKWHKSHHSPPYEISYIEKSIAHIEESLSRFRIVEKPLDK